MVTCYILHKAAVWVHIYFVILPSLFPIKAKINLYSNVVAYSCVWHITHLLQSLCSTLSLIAAPSSAPVVNVTVVDSTTVFIDWEPPLPHEANGIITGYTVNVSVTETQTQTQYLVSNTTELMLTELHPYYTYTVIVSASTIKPGPFSMEHTVVTLPAGEWGVA